MPHTDLLLLFQETPATSTAWPLLSAGLAALQCRKGLCGQLPEVLLSPYDFQAVNMASLGAPGGCAQQGRESQAEEDHCIRVAPSLGGLARSCQGFQSSSGGLGGHSLKKHAVRVVESLYSRNTTAGCRVPFLSGIPFRLWEPNSSFFLVAIVKWRINKYMPIWPSVIWSN